MKCDAFWGLDGPPHKYIVEFNRKEVEELLLKHLEGELYAEDFGQQVWDILLAEYEKHNKE